MNFKNPPREEVRQLLERAQTIAVVGLSPKRERDSFHVASALQQFGYKVVPVHPGAERILNEPVVHDLKDVKKADIVDVFRAPEHVDEIVDACIAKGFKVLWLQEGVINEAAAEKARKAGMMVIMDRCILKEWIALMGSTAA
jgi:predicted CoA-binding protein